MQQKRFLTKSRFLLAVGCPTKLFYTGKSEYENQSAGDDFLAMLADGGYQVGALAKLRYPEGIEVDATSNDAAALQTRELLKRKNVVLFEPAICVGGFFVRIDILVKKGNKFELIEVKAKSYNSIEPEIERKRGGINGDMLPYIQDAAFQTWVLQQALPDAKIKTFLMMPDKAMSAPVNGVNQMFKIVQVNKRSKVELRPIPGQDLQALATQLLAKVNVDKHVTSVLSEPIAFPGGPKLLSETAPAWAMAYQQDKKITPVIGKHCGGCEFDAPVGGGAASGFRECWKQATKMTDRDFKGAMVFDLWNYRGKADLIEKGTYKIKEVTREDIGDFEDKVGESGLSRQQRQWLQVKGVPKKHRNGEFYFDQALASREMSTWKFPLHFIDFETASVALPFYKDMRPYEPVCFQFSHHVMEADGTVRHAGEFLNAKPGQFPNYELARALMAELQADDGTVFMWSHHENTMLTKIADQLEAEPNPPKGKKKLVAFIRSLIRGGDRAMVDLCVLAERAFFHPDTNGGNSIKQVLPAVLQVSTYLRNTYSKPVYGAPKGIPSLNYASREGFVWLEAAEEECDPYNRLKQLAVDLLPEAAEEGSVIAEGGAAATAYARLQFEDMDAALRGRIESALLRYCELDTLAMVMVVQAWRALIKEASCRA